MMMMRILPRTSAAGIVIVTTQAVTDWKGNLVKMFTAEGTSLMWQNRDELLQFLLTHHDVFAINEDELGETDLTIDTEVTQPKCVPPLEEHQWQLSKKLQLSCEKSKIKK